MIENMIENMWENRVPNKILKNKKKFKQVSNFNLKSWKKSRNEKWK